MFKSLGPNLDFPHSRWVPWPRRYLILHSCHLLLVSTRNSIQRLTNLFWWKFLWNWYLPAKNVCFLKPAFSIKKRENSQPLLTISLMGKSKPLVQLGNGQLGWHIWQHSRNQGTTVLPTNTWASHHSYKMCWRDGFVTPRFCAPSSSFIRSQYASLLLETLVWFCD